MISEHWDLASSRTACSGGEWSADRCVRRVARLAPATAERAKLASTSIRAVAKRLHASEVNSWMKDVPKAVIRIEELKQITNERDENLFLDTN